MKRIIHNSQLITQQGGYTLIELLTVIMIISFLGAATYGLFGTIRSKNLVRTSSNRILIFLESARAKAVHGKSYTDPATGEVTSTDWCVALSANIDETPIEMDRYDASVPTVCPIDESEASLSISAVTLTGSSLSAPLIFTKNGSVKIFDGVAAVVDLSNGEYSFTVNAGGAQERITVRSNGLITREAV